jgi:hypothetical protein
MSMPIYPFRGKNEPVKVTAVVGIGYKGGSK